jgi:hypothetical protein
MFLISHVEISYFMPHFNAKSAPENPEKKETGNELVLIRDISRYENSETINLIYDMLFRNIF